MYQIIAIIVCLFGCAQTQDANCNVSTSVSLGYTYIISNPRYPDNYRPGVSCRWIMTCPSGYNCRVDCTDVNIPQTPTCSVDRLLISMTGDPQLASAKYYCGQGKISAVSTGQTITIGLVTSSASPGGRFRCELIAQLDTSSTCNCGYRKMNRIVGGKETNPNEYTMMAGIVYTAERNIKCGGVILTEYYVLTAGHCVYRKALTDLAVVVGEHDVSTGNDTTQMTQVFRVASYKVHPQFTTDNYDWDAATVRVDGQIIMNENVGPVCMPFKYSTWDFANANVIMLGWGTQSPGGPASKVLREVTVQVISQSTCKNSITSLTPRQMCTYTRGKDACQDDSGGPLLYSDPQTGSLYIVGIISYGYFCASDTPGVNTRVTALLDWIVQNAPGNYCRK